MDNIEFQPVPEVGKFYHFFDDGKKSTDRHYICKVERIITPEEAKHILVKVPSDDIQPIENDGELCYELIDLYKHWHENEMPNHDWLYNTNTDYFVEISCPTFDKNNLWAVRTKDGGWFTMDIESFWQSGRIDVTEEIFKNVIQYIKNHPEYYCVEKVLEVYNNTKYDKK